MSTEIDFGTFCASLSSVAITITADDFVRRYANWTDISIKKPLLLVKPSVEDDIVVAIRWAGILRRHAAVRGGGHSAFNTMPGELLLGLREYKSATYDEASRILTVWGGATNGEALCVLAKNNR